MTEEQRPKGPMGWIRRMYDWVLGWAETPYGAPALFVLAFAESSFFPIPPMYCSSRSPSLRPRAPPASLICTAGSVLGGVAGYAIGVYGWEAIGQPIVNAYHGQPVMDKFKPGTASTGSGGRSLRRSRRSCTRSSRSHRVYSSSRSCPS